MKILTIFIFFLFTLTISAQNLPQTDFQSWNDVTFTKPIVKAKDSKNKSYDKFSVFFSGTMRFGNKVQNITDQRAGFGFDFKANPFITFTTSYTYVVSRPKVTTHDYENRLGFAATFEKKFGKIGLKDRNLVEYRIRNSKADSTRYRNKFTFSYDIAKDKKTLFTVFATVEPHYDFTSESWNRNESFFGITRKFTKNLSTDFFYIRQDNKSGLPKAINGIGVSFKVKLD